MYIEERVWGDTSRTGYLFLFGAMLDDPGEFDIVESSFWINWGTIEHFVTFLFSKSENRKRIYLSM
jgi:hypothetical protein